MNNLIWCEDLIMQKVGQEALLVIADNAKYRSLKN